MKSVISILLILLLFQLSCKKDNRNSDVVSQDSLNYYQEDYNYGIFDSSAFKLNYPDFISRPLSNEQNPLTQNGVLLGRKLFYDPILSADSSIKCASCHSQNNAFSSPSTGLKNEYKGIIFERNSMALFNKAWESHFAWDMRTESLEDKVKTSIENQHGMNGNWEIILNRLINHSTYPRDFYQAFGIYKIEEQEVVKAIAQFIRSILSFNAPFDQYLQGQINLPDEALLGYQIFSTEKGDCFHCHTIEGALFNLNDALNNGIDSSKSTTGFDDFGYGNVTDNEFDNGKFKSVSIRNVGFTAPYMHDGRFQTLNEVLEHYNSGGHFSPTVSPTMKYIGEGLALSQEEMLQLEAFLKTLNDSSLLKNSSFSNPFNDE